MVKSVATSDIALLCAMFLWVMATLTLACLPLDFFQDNLELLFVLCITFGFGGILSMAIGFIVE